MSHPTGDALLLLAYGELPAPDVERVEAHLGECASCRAQFTQLDTAQVALDAATAPRRRIGRPWLVGVLAAAAVLATVFLTSSGPPRRVHPEWRPLSTWSATAGYITDRAMVEIDAQLTRLEQERYHGLSN